MEVVPINLMNNNIKVEQKMSVFEFLKKLVEVFYLLTKENNLEVVTFNSEQMYPIVHNLYTVRQSSIHVNQLLKETVSKLFKTMNE